MNLLEEFKYDVAFSFLQEDEQLAYEINDLIQDRFKSFIYSEHQAEIVGNDGEKKFNEVFGKEARLVVILYRDKWGNTCWTRIEETAIRNRAHLKGYDFTIFVMLDKTSKMPEWIPKVRIYADYSRWGSKGVAAVIETRIHELGGEGQPESLEDLANRVKRQVLLEQKRKFYMGSTEAYKDAQTEFKILYDLVVHRSEKLQDPSINLHFAFEKHPGRRLILFSLPFSLYLEWECNFINTLEGSKVTIAICKLDYDQHKYLMEGRRYSLAINDIAVSKREYKFDYNPISCEKGWRCSINKSEFINSEKLVEEWLFQFIGMIGKQKINRNR